MLPPPSVELSYVLGPTSDGQRRGQKPCVLSEKGWKIDRKPSHAREPRTSMPPEVRAPYLPRCICYLVHHWIKREVRALRRFCTPSLDVVPEPKDLGWQVV